MKYLLHAQVQGSCPYHYQQGVECWASRSHGKVNRAQTTGWKSSCSDNLHVSEKHVNLHETYFKITTLQVTSGYNIHCEWESTSSVWMGMVHNFN